jgi:oxygen-dependent protoporphyrinogen oxidase
MSNVSIRVAVVGAGISGLVTAYRLQELGFDVDVIEASGRTGGVIESFREDGWLSEAGPHTYLETSPRIRELVNAIGLESALCEPGPEAKNRFIVRDGKPYPLPSSPVSFLKTPLFSKSAKLRLLREPFISKWDNSYEESLAGFVTRRLGQEFLDYAINPFVSGVYAGDPGNLSVKSAFPKLFDLEQEYGSLIKGAILGARKRKKRSDTSKQRAKMYSFRKGMGQLAGTLTEILEQSIQTKTEVETLRRENNRWMLEWKSDGKKGKGDYDVVVSTVPLHRLPKIILNDKIFDSQRLQEVSYPPVSVLTMGFERKNVKHPLNGFGMLVPAVENSSILGTLFTSTLFPGRAPEGYITLASYVGGARNPESAKEPFDLLRDNVLLDLQRFLGVQSSPVYVKHILQPKAIPQYNVGYEQVREMLDNLEKSQHGLFFTGNYRSGISVSDCIVGGLETADKVGEQLQ